MEEKTENLKVKRLDSIAEELFKPIKGGSALERYARVRHTLYEIKLWRKYNNMPISEIPAVARNYFCERFLEKSLSKASEKEINQAITRLGYAENSCKKRCTELVEDFNVAVRRYNDSHARKLEEVHDIESFLDFFTFKYIVRTDYEGEPIIEKPYGFEIRDFYDKRNRSEAWHILKRLLDEGRIASMQNIYRFSKIIYINSVKI